MIDDCNKWTNRAFSVIDDDKSGFEGMIGVKKSA